MIPNFSLILPISWSGCFVAMEITSPPICSFKSGWSVQRHDPALVQDEHAVASIALVDEMRGHQDRHAFLVAQLLKVQPEIVPRSGIEPDRGFVQDQQLRAMQQSFRQFHAPREASGQRFHQIFGSIGNSQPLHHFRNSAVQFSAAHP